MKKYTMLDNRGYPWAHINYRKLNFDNLRTVFSRTSVMNCSNGGKIIESTIHTLGSEVGTNHKQFAAVRKTNGDILLISTDREYGGFRDMVRIYGTDLKIVECEHRTMDPGCIVPSTYRFADPQPDLL